jgi:hypothetical protein
MNFTANNKQRASRRNTPQRVALQRFATHRPVPLGNASRRTVTRRRASHRNVLSEFLNHEARSIRIIA